VKKIERKIKKVREKIRGLKIEKFMEKWVKKNGKKIPVVTPIAKLTVSLQRQRSHCQPLARSTVS